MVHKRALASLSIITVTLCCIGGCAPSVHRAPSPEDADFMQRFDTEKKKSAEMSERIKRFGGSDAEAWSYAAKSIASNDYAAVVWSGLTLMEIIEADPKQRPKVLALLEESAKKTKDIDIKKHLLATYSAALSYDGPSGEQGTPATVHESVAHQERIEQARSVDQSARRFVLEQLAVRPPQVARVGPLTVLVRAVGYSAEDREWALGTVRKQIAENRGAERQYWTVVLKALE